MEIKKIIEGWRNYVSPPKDLKKEIEAVYNERMAVCRECEHFSENKRKHDPSIIRLDEYCTACGCTLAAKARCLSCTCPYSKWKK